MGWTLINGKFQWQQPKEAGDYTKDPAYIDIAGILKTGNQAFVDHQKAVAEGKADYNPNFMEPYLNQIEIAKGINSEIKAKYDGEQAKIDAAKGKAAADAKAAADKRAKDLETARARAAGEASAEFLEASAKTQKEAADKRISGLYGGLQTSAKDRLDLMLKQLETDTATASKAVQDANEQYLKSVRPSTAYTAPVTQLNVSENPLLAALQQQGAGTEEVAAATNLAQQTAGATSDLQKWAMGQLNVGQQNFEGATQNANAQALQAALQNLATKKSQIGTGFQSDYSSAIDKINADQAAAQGASDAEIQKLINEAAAIRAKTIAETGPTPEAGSKEARNQAVAMAPSKYANFQQAVKAMNPNFDAKKAGKTAEQAFPALAAAFGKKKTTK